MTDRNAWWSRSCGVDDRTRASFLWNRVGVALGMVGNGFARLLLGLALWCLHGGGYAAVSPPNVLFILSDDLNAEASGYGHDQVHTPHLDAFAESAVTFGRAFCQFPLCAPSRASLFTGQYPLTNGVAGNGRAVDPERMTLPRYFARHGYWAARVSKVYHMGIPVDLIEGTSGMDHAASWEETFNVTAMETMTPGTITDYTQPEAVAVLPAERPKWRAAQAQGLSYSMVGAARGQYAVVEVQEADAGTLADAMAAERAVDWLQDRSRDRRPFFLAVGLVRPHFPFVATQEALAPYEASALSVAEVPSGDHEDIPAAAIGGVLRLEREALQGLRRGYYGAVTFMDQQVGRILGALDQLGLRSNTIVVFASDHGYLLGEHHMWKKNLLWEEAIRGPLMISAPGFPAGTAVDHVVELVDIYPTLVELAGLPQEPLAQGQSLVPLLRDPEARLERADALIQTSRGFGLRVPGWAYMWYPPSAKRPEASAMVYDMRKDPNQYTNLAGREAYQKVEQDLHARLIQRIEDARSAPGRRARRVK